MYTICPLLAGSHDPAKDDRCGNMEARASLLERTGDIQGRLIGIFK